jgi:SAM-dependent methyltransferase
VKSIFERGTLGRLVRRWREPDLLGGRPEELWRELIARHAPGRSFVDVGCMWKVDGAYAFHALASGATAVTGIDVAPATPAFAAKNAAVGDRVRFLQGDLNDPRLGEWAGTYDVVFCSGVLYHVPDPIFTLTQLRRLCTERLLLTTASTTLAPPQSAILLPFLDDETRRRHAFPRQRGRKIGLDSDFEADKGYANWFWLPTPSCVVAMARLAGFAVEACHVHRRVTTVVARPDGERPTY